MIPNEILQTIQQETERLFQALEARLSVASATTSDGTVSLDLTIEDPQIFIGENGQTLFEIQHIVRSMIRKKLNQHILLFLDINGYRKSKEIYLQELAHSTADDVALFKKEKELQHMSSIDRRIIHIALGQRSDVASESVGEEPNRRVVIRPAS